MFDTELKEDKIVDIGISGRFMVTKQTPHYRNFYNFINDLEEVVGCFSISFSAPYKEKSSPYDFRAQIKPYSPEVFYKIANNLPDNLNIEYIILSNKITEDVLKSLYSLGYKDFYISFEISLSIDLNNFCRILLKYIDNIEKFKFSYFIIGKTSSVFNFTSEELTLKGLCFLIKSCIENNISFYYERIN